MSIRFICDDHLGKLARYLRTGGFDTYYDSGISNDSLIRVALDEERIILTRDRKLTEQVLARRSFWIKDNSWPAQLKAVLTHFNLEFSSGKLFVRCMEDNQVTTKVSKEEIRDLIYPYTYQTQSDFRRCPACRRVYWPGTHVTAMVETLRKHGIVIVG